MAEEAKIGTVTRLDNLFTYEEAKKAARRVEKDIVCRQKELRLLCNFISDNSTLIHHVKKLPEEPSHPIMVPFGCAAFFPGRLIHTNEFLVLLGEGYFAERSSKQTVEILQRRGESLLVHFESLKRIVKDLEVEAAFFDSTSAEVAEGLVEIREEYVEEIQIKKPETGLPKKSLRGSSKPKNNSDFSDDEEEDEDDKIMARLDELEKEEEKAENDIGDDKDAETASSSDVDNDEIGSYLIAEKNVDDEEEDDEDNIYDNAEKVLGTEVQASSLKEQVACEGSLKEIAEHPLLIPEKKEKLLKSPHSSFQAFTGTVIEHNYSLSDTKSMDDTSAQPSRPISRFKLEKYKS